MLVGLRQLNSVNRVNITMVPITWIARWDMYVLVQGLPILEHRDAAKNVQVKVPQAPQVQLNMNSAL